MNPPSRREQLETLLHDDPHDPFLRYALAMELESAGDTPGAIAHLRDLVRAFPEYVPAFLQVGQLLAQAGDFSDARTYLKMGMDVAFKVADQHAYSEMEGILAGLPQSPPD
jgi:predicted Zn-dependent protease